MPAAKKVTPLKAQQAKSWSFSVYNLYNQCARRYKYAKLDKLPEPKNAAMDRGNDLHGMAEGYIKGTIARVPKELKRVAAELKALRTMYKNRVKLGLKGMAPSIEDTWAFTRDWSLTTWNDWTGCWLRVKLDAGWWETATRFRVDDWKSGSFRVEKNEEYVEQLELYALGALLTYLHCEEVVSRLIYVDQDGDKSEALIYPPPGEEIVYTRKDIPRLKKAWEKRTRALMNDKTFAPRPGWYCAGCYFNHATQYGYGKNKLPKPAGPCKY